MVILRTNLRGHVRRVTGCLCDAFTLTEVVIALTLAVVLVSGIIVGFVQCTKGAEWSAYNLAANSLAMQRMEQARAAQWDWGGSLAKDELVSTNFPDITTNVLDVPYLTSNKIYATTTVRIIEISTSPQLRMIRAECTWSLMGRGPFTNVICTYRAPDQSSQ